MTHPYEGRWFAAISRVWVTIRRAGDNYLMLTGDDGSQWRTNTTMVRHLVESRLLTRIES